MTGNDWPALIEFLRSYVLKAVNLEVVSLASPSCVGFPMNFYYRFIFMLSASAAFIGVPWILSLIRLCMHRKRERWVKAKRRRLHDTVMLVLLVYTTITAQAFYFFRCQKVASDTGNNTNYYLMADYSIKCYDSAYWSMFVLVATVLLLFSAGMPIGNAILLWKYRSKLESDEDVKKLLGTLYTSYTPRHYYFESINMLFKLVLLMSLVIFDQGSQFQYATVLLATFFQITVHAKAQPYRTLHSNLLQFCGVILSFVSAFGGMLTGYIKLERKEANLRLFGKAREDNEREIQAKQDKVNLAITIATSIILAGYVSLFVKGAFDNRHKHIKKVKSVGSMAKKLAKKVRVEARFFV
eukprot:g5280.t1